MDEHTVLKVVGFVIAWIVTFLSAVKTTVSAFLVAATDGPTDNGSVLGPLIYRVAMLLSNSKVLSKSAYPFGAVPAGTISGKNSLCTPPMACPQAVI